MGFKYEGTKLGQLVDGAYARWQAVEDCTRRAMLMQLSPIERTAFVIAGYIAQVNNGGHSQWLENGYCADDLDFLLHALDMVGTTDRGTAEEARGCVTKAAGHVDVFAADSFDEHEYERACEDLDAWDDRFYDTDLGNRLANATEAYLAAAEGRGTL